MDNRSTLKPAQVAHIMVANAVAKHKDRYENIFWKAVSSILPMRIPRHLQITNRPLHPVCGRRHVVLWEPLITNHVRRFSCSQLIQSWPRQNPRRSSVPCRFDNVRTTMVFRILSVGFDVCGTFLPGSSSMVMNFSRVTCL